MGEFVENCRYSKLLNLIFKPCLLVGNHRCTHPSHTHTACQWGILLKIDCNEKKIEGIRIQASRERAVVP